MEKKRAHVLSTPLNRGIVASFIVLLVALLALSLVGIGILRGMRGFVLQEALWSKAEKQASAALQAYIWTGVRSFHRDFEEHLRTPLELRRAREALDAAEPDRAEARDALLAGGLPAELVGPMVSIFIRFRGMDFVERAATSWAAADEAIEELAALGAEARSAWDDGQPRERYLNDLSNRTGRVEERLTELADAFSTTFTDGALQVERWLMGMLLSVGLLVLLAGAGGGTVIFREMEGRERALEASERRHRLLFEQSTMPVFLATTEGVMLRCNRAAARLLGVEEPAALVGCPMSDFLPETSAWDEEVRALLDAGTVRGVEEPWRGADGRNLWVLRSGTLVEDPDTGERVILRTAQDITERRGLEERLARTERLEAMGQLAGGVAHDFNNLLTAVMGYAQLLIHELESSEEPNEVALEAVGEIMKAADTAAALTRQLLTFSRSHVDAGELVEVGGAIRNVESILRRMVPGGIDLVTELDSTEEWVRIDPSKLEQVALNLVINARDAIGKEGEIRLITDTVEVSEGDKAGELDPGRYVRLRVLDTGPGIPEELREKIFEPFFSTKADGTGMGLATVFGVVRGGGGSVTVQSGRDGGTVIEVLLPSADLDGGEEDPARPTGARAKAGTILVVDDNEAVRAFAESVLRRAGHRVRTAASGPEGIEAARELAAELDLIVCDVVMPGMSGPEMVQRVLTEVDDVRVVYISGYTDQALGDEEVKRRGRFLQKPFTPDALRTVAEELLAERY